MSDMWGFDSSSPTGNKGNIKILHSDKIVTDYFSDYRLYDK